MATQAALSKKFLASLRKVIRSADKKRLLEKTARLHPADIAEIMKDLEFEEAEFMYKNLQEERASEVLVHLEDEMREQILASLSSKEIAEDIDLESDDAADVISELSPEQKEEVISHLEDKEQQSDIVNLLTYEEGTAGALMAKELISVNHNWTVLKCVKEMRRQAEEVKVVYTVYVVDDHQVLLGLLSLKRLLISPAETKISDIYNPNIISVRTDTSSEEVAMIMEKYDLVVLPVVDAEGRLMGRITIDDVVDVIRQEETEDIHKMGGMEALEDSYSSTSVMQMVKKRGLWLVILFAGEGLTATAMSFFEDQLAKAVVLAFFVPLIISSGGNTGSQATTLITRALALNEISISDWWKVLKKEVLSGFLLGLALGILGFLRVFLWSAFVNIYGEHWALIGMTVFISLLGVVMWGNIMGAILPLGLKKLGLDPAVSSAPFVATLVDVTGIIIYFVTATLMLEGILL
jgi:magnesium transporter